MTSQEIRQQFLDFFKNRQHKIVASSPIVVKDDPTLMFTNAGMNQFKEFFLGQKKAIDKRVADTQKCLRVSGKHNDLEEVGMDTYHHTMFEMLGNWSFGDYFKKEAIHWAWELLTEVYKLDKDSLYVSVFEGNNKEGLEKDQEAYDYWKELIDEDRIILGNKKDNFWEMGAQGPCGPSSEIHVDMRSKEEKAKLSGKDLVNQDHPLVIEIWNLVFMEFNRKSNGNLEKLPQKHVDTGMGFERLCMVIQNKQSNYDTDVFTPLIQQIQTITGFTYGKSKKVDIAIRVIADHVRAVAFAIADGQMPSNNGAGYVIRRILRRAIRYGFTFLNQKEPFIYQLVAVLSKTMGAIFPEISAQKQFISNVINEEEKSFLRTLDQGLLLIDSIIKHNDSTSVSGKKIFELYDTFGFPKDLTALILRENNLTFDESEFDVEMEKQKRRSRAASTIKTDDWIVLLDDNEEKFIGYDLLEATVKITKYRKVSSKKEGAMYQLVFNITPFYPEGGGQVGDQGILTEPNGNKIKILTTKKENNLIIHFTKTLPENINQTFTAQVNEDLRKKTACNHSATHLLHQALRTVLGNHVEQKGSLVNSKHLRFDFSHYSKLTDIEIKEVEDFVNKRIKEQIPLNEFRNIPINTALEKGAIALFGEKYGDTVRMIKFDKSAELCGGTHVKETGNIWQFKILSESAIASGIRRIEAITGSEVINYYKKGDEELLAVKQLLNQSNNPKVAVENLQKENLKLKKQVAYLLKEKISHLKTSLLNTIENINDINFIKVKVDLDQNAIKNLAFELGNQINNLFLIAGSSIDGKAFLTVYISKDLAAKNNLNAGQIVRDLGKLIQGGGGGQPFFATAGGKNPAGIETALEQAKSYLN